MKTNFTAMQIKNVILSVDSRANARQVAKDTGGKIVDRGASSGKRWGVMVDRIHCADFGTIQVVTRRTIRFIKEVKCTLPKDNNKSVVVMTSKGAKQWATLNRVKVA